MDRGPFPSESFGFLSALLLVASAGFWFGSLGSALWGFLVPTGGYLFFCALAGFCCVLSPFTAVLHRTHRVFGILFPPFPLDFFTGVY